MDIGFIYALGAAIVWGLAYTLDQLILESVSPLVLLFVHSALASLVTLPLVLLLEPHGLKAFTYTLQTQTWLVVGTVSLAVLAGFLILASIKALDAQTASIIEISYPFFVVLFSMVIFRSTPSAAFFVGACLLFVGSYIIIRYT